jgi:hypothetical protein
VAGVASADVLRQLLARQNGAVTVAQARDLGLSRQQLRTLVTHGWTRPVRGVLVEPSPADPFRAGLRAAMLGSPSGAPCRVSAARLHGLSGLARWTAPESPQLLLPAGTERAQRRGMRTYAGLRSTDVTVRGGFRLTTLDRTLADLAANMRLDDFICLLDSALHLGWRPTARAGSAVFKLALAKSDGRSESALETRLRLLLAGAGLAPEELQHRLCDDRDRCFARLDFAWPSRKLAVEADGREHHDKPEALYRDRQRQNDITLAGWLVLRFTWYDVVHQPEWVISQVRSALARALNA